MLRRKIFLSILLGLGIVATAAVIIDNISINRQNSFVIWLLIPFGIIGYFLIIKKASKQEK